MTAHLLPAGEPGEHETTAACRCRPDVERGRRGDGTYGRVVVHHDAAGEPAAEQIEE